MIEPDAVAGDARFDVLQYLILERERCARMLEDPRCTAYQRVYQTERRRIVTELAREVEAMT